MNEGTLEPVLRQSNTHTAITERAARLEMTEMEYVGAKGGHDHWFIASIKNGKREFGFARDNGKGIHHKILPFDTIEWVFNEEEFTFDEFKSKALEDTDKLFRDLSLDIEPNLITAYKAKVKNLTEDGFEKWLSEAKDSEAGYVFDNRAHGQTVQWFNAFLDDLAEGKDSPKAYKIKQIRDTINHFILIQKANNVEALKTLVFQDPETLQLLVQIHNNWRERPDVSGKRNAEGEFENPVKNKNRIFNENGEFREINPKELENYKALAEEYTALLEPIILVQQLPSLLKQVNNNGEGLWEGAIERVRKPLHQNEEIPSIITFLTMFDILGVIEAEIKNNDDDLGYTDKLIELRHNMQNAIKYDANVGVMEALLNHLENEENLQQQKELVVAV